MLTREMLPAWRNPNNFITVSDPYPTVSAISADLILPTAMWAEKEGAFGNAERRTQFGVSKYLRLGIRNQIYGRSWNFPGVLP